LAANVIKDLIDAGVHFGHRASRWNPKMKPYILAKRNAIHIIDPKQTLRGLMMAKKFFTQVVSSGKDVLLVGTKRQARKAVEDHARRVGMHFINDRWLGGTLTNFRTIRSRLERLVELEQLEAEGQMDERSKKEAARRRRELRKIKRNLDGVRDMDRMPGAIFVVDVHREIIALREARKLHIPTVALIDTDSDPDMVDIPIPGNDDAMRAIDLIARELCNAAEMGKASRSDKGEEAAAPAEQPRRRSRRPVMARASEEEKPKEGEAAAEKAPAAESAAAPPAEPATDSKAPPPTEPAPEPPRPEPVEHPKSEPSEDRPTAPTGAGPAEPKPEQPKQSEGAEQASNQ
jgi:small subunit ribosomal protein S2